MRQSPRTCRRTPPDRLQTGPTGWRDSTGVDAGKPVSPRSQRRRRQASIGNGAGRSTGRATRPRAATRGASTSGTARTLEGNKAHGRRGRASAGNGSCAPRTRQRSNALKSRVVAARIASAVRAAEAQRQEGKGPCEGWQQQERGTAAVGGTSSKGANGAAGRIARRRACHTLTFGWWLSRSRVGGAKRGEPRPASGCNTPETAQLEKPVEVVRNHGRNVTGWLAPAGRSKAATSCGSGQLRWYVGGGAHLIESHERHRTRRTVRSGATGRASLGALKSKRKPRGPLPVVLTSRHGSRAGRKTLGTHPVTEEGREGRSEGQASCYCTRWMARTG